LGINIAQTMYPDPGDKSETHFTLSELNEFYAEQLAQGYQAYRVVFRLQENAEAAAEE